MKIVTADWVERPDGSVVCEECGALLMTAEENARQAPPTAGLYTRSNAAAGWQPQCCSRFEDEA